VIKTTAITAASDRYMRCSWMTSLVATKVDVGASVRKKQAPRKPSRCRRTRAQVVARSSSTITDAGNRTAEKRLSPGFTQNCVVLTYRAGALGQNAMRR
jgi:hypothetical protein